MEREAFLSVRPSLQLLGLPATDGLGVHYKSTTYHSFLSTTCEDWGKVDTGCLRKPIAAHRHQEERRAEHPNGFASIEAAR